MTADTMINLIKKDGAPLYRKNADGEYINLFQPNYSKEERESPECTQNITMSACGACGACGACACRRISRRTDTDKRGDALSLFKF